MKYKDLSTRIRGAQAIGTGNAKKGGSTLIKDDSAQTQCPDRRQVTFTDHDFEAVRDILYSTAGISLDNGKHDLVYGRLARRLRACRFVGCSL